MKVVLNKCYGGFGLSDAAYEWLNKNAGIPIIKYTEQVRGEDGLYKPEPKNDGEVIFDCELSLDEGDSFGGNIYRKYRDAEKKPILFQRYWDSFIRRDCFRNDPRLVECVDKLGEKASGSMAKLVVVEIPDNIEWEIDDYDGIESIHEKHRSW